MEVWKPLAFDDEGNPTRYGWQWEAAFVGDVEPGKADPYPAANPARRHLDVKWSNPGASWWNQGVIGPTAYKLVSPSGGTETLVRMPNGVIAVELPADTIDGGSVTDSGGGWQSTLLEYAVPAIIGGAAFQGVTGLAADAGFKVPSLSDLWTAGENAFTGPPAPGFDNAVQTVLDTAIEVPTNTTTGATMDPFDYGSIDFGEGDYSRVFQSSGAYEDIYGGDPLARAVGNLPDPSAGYEPVSNADYGVQSPAPNSTWAADDAIDRGTSAGSSWSAEDAIDRGTVFAPKSDLTDKILDSVKKAVGNAVLKTVPIVGINGEVGKKTVSVPVPAGTRVVTSGGKQILVDAQGRAINAAGQTVLRWSNGAVVRLPSGQQVTINPDGTVPSESGAGKILALGAGALIAMKLF